MAAVLAACAPSAETGSAPSPGGSVLDIMQAITVPASNTIFRAGSEEPADSAAWVAVEQAAVDLAESGNLLMMPGRAVDGGEWMVQSRAMVEAAYRARDAARARNLDALLDSGDAVYATCEGCHSVYLPR